MLMLIWHTAYEENENLGLHVKKVADPWCRVSFLERNALPLRAHKIKSPLTTRQRIYIFNINLIQQVSTIIPPYTLLFIVIHPTSFNIHKYAQLGISLFKDLFHINKQLK